MRSPIRWKWKKVIALLIVLIFILYLITKLCDGTLQCTTNSSKKYDDTINSDMSNIKKSFYKKWEETNGQYNPNDPGENGQPIKTKTEDEFKKNKAYSEYGFNQFTSDKISLHRSLPDPRPHQYVTFDHYAGFFSIIQLDDLANSYPKTSLFLFFFCQLLRF